MNDSKSLPALIQEASELAHMLVESSGELPPQLEISLDMNRELIAQKTDQYGWVVDQAQGQLSIIAIRIEALKKIATSLEKGIENIHSRMQYAIESLGVTELSGEETRFVLMQNPPRVVVDDMSQIPRAYSTPAPPPPEPGIDKKKILEDLKSGKTIPGCHIERGVRVQRKINTSFKKVGSR